MSNAVKSAFILWTLNRVYSSNRDRTEFAGWRLLVLARCYRASNSPHTQWFTTHLPIRRPTTQFRSKGPLTAYCLLYHTYRCAALWPVARWQLAQGWRVVGVAHRNCQEKICGRNSAARQYIRISYFIYIYTSFHKWVQSMPRFLVHT